MYSRLQKSFKYDETVTVRLEESRKRGLNIVDRNRQSLSLALSLPIWFLTPRKETCEVQVYVASYLYIIHKPVEQNHVSRGLRAASIQVPLSLLHSSRPFEHVSLSTRTLCRERRSFSPLLHPFSSYSHSFFIPSPHHFSLWNEAHWVYCAFAFETNCWMR